MYKLALAAVVGLACLLCASPAAKAADPGAEDPNNWSQYNRTTNAWRYSPLDQINKNNVGRLSVAWIAHGGDITMGIQETPLAIDGIIYSITSGDRARRDLDPQGVFQSIANGREKNGIRMPAWREVLSDEQIRQATAYVLSISGQPR